MPNNYLFVVEGASDEKNLLSEVFSRYGFNVVRCKERISVDSFGDFDKYELSQNLENIVIIEGPRNRIHDFLLYYDQKIDSIEKLFHYSTNYFAGIFLIYDVDHNDVDDIDEMFKKFSDESTGLLLLNSPCLEVLGDTRINDEHIIYCHHLSEYKRDLNVYHEKNGSINSATYIKNNFNKIMLFFLDQNVKELNCKNVMEHPILLKERINRDNIRINCKNKEESYVLYRFFSTVIYVAIAYANKLVYEVNNYNKVRSFFIKKEKTNK